MARKLTKLARKRRSRGPVICGRVVPIRSYNGLAAFVRNNGGIQALARQAGESFAALAFNGNSTIFFNGDLTQVRTIVGFHVPIIPMRV